MKTIKHQKKLFDSEEDAIEFLASRLGYSVEEIEALNEMGSNVFEGLEYYSPQDIIDSQTDFAKTFIGREWAAKTAAKSAPSVGKKSKSDWAAKSIRKAAAAIALKAGGAHFKGGNYAIHHKISRSNLRRLYLEMLNDPSGSARIYSLLDRISGLVGSTDYLRILLNMPANLEVGPQNPVGDPGSGFDPNPGTPRSGALARANRLIEQGKFELGAAV